MKKILLLAISAFIVTSCSHKDEPSPKPLPTPAIKIVTMTESGHNKISWTNEDAIQFQFINIYKEEELNVFKLLASTSAANCSYDDPESDGFKPQRYYITGIKADSIESSASTIHKTIHLDVCKTGGGYLLTWNKYEGLPILSYAIVRGAEKWPVAPIDYIPSSDTCYTDLTPNEQEPYYAILYSTPATNKIKSTAPPPDTYYGLSNVVDIRNLK